MQFYLGGADSGAQPHMHEHAWNIAVHGAKRWLVWPPATAFYSGKFVQCDAAFARNARATMMMDLMVILARAVPQRRPRSSFCETISPHLKGCTGRGSACSTVAISCTFPPGLVIWSSIYSRLLVSTFKQYHKHPIQSAYAYA